MNTVQHHPAIAEIQPLPHGNPISISILFGIGAVVAAFFAFHNWEGMKWERFADEMPFVYEFAKKYFIK